jgi:5-methylcytosine-specific restriction enzyme B
MSLDQLVSIVHDGPGEKSWPESNQEALDALFGAPQGRYPALAARSVALRAPELSGDAGVPFAAYIHPSNPNSGPYGGMSIAIFPVADAPALVTFVVGTAGLSPDEMILGRPGHGRKLQAVSRWLNQMRGDGRLIAWSKYDPVRIEQAVPETVQRTFSQYKGVFDRYGHVIYALFAPVEDRDLTRRVLAGYLDIMFEERGHLPLSGSLDDSQRLRTEWFEHVMPRLDEDDVVSLLGRRRYVVLQGPPGTGKTRMARRLIAGAYGGRGESIQFHANTTYEDFIGGLAPAQSDADVGLRFRPQAGFLMRAATRALEDTSRPYLLHVDEINRADLAKVLGEAIFLLEPDEARELQLPHDFGEPFGRTLSLPPNLHLVGTMNTADRTLAVIDVAIRRRFGFARMWPRADVVNELGGGLMGTAYRELVGLFVEHATEDAFDLVPGHSYFLAADDAEALQKLRVELVPLLEEYLAQGFVGGFAEHVRSYLQWVEAL